MRTLQTVCAWATFKLQLTFWAVPVHVLGLLFSPLNMSIPAWLRFQLCRFCLLCPPDSRDVNSPGLWSVLGSSVLVSLGDTGRGWQSAAAHWLLAAVNPECSPGFGHSLQLCCSSCTHQKADDGAQGWGLDFSLLIVSEFSVGDKTSSLKEIQLHLFLYLFKRLLFLSHISRGSSTFFPLHWQHCPCLTPNKS